MQASATTQSSIIKLQRRKSSGTTNNCRNTQTACDSSEIAEHSLRKTKFISVNLRTLTEATINYNGLVSRTTHLAVRRHISGTLRYLSVRRPQCRETTLIQICVFNDLKLLKSTSTAFHRFASTWKECLWGQKRNVNDGAKPISRVRMRKRPGQRGSIRSQRLWGELSARTPKNKYYHCYYFKCCASYADLEAIRQHVSASKKT